MKHWSDDDRVEHENATEEAWAVGSNDAERTDEFLRILRDAEQAQRRWAEDVLTAALRDGAWKHLKERHKAVNRNTVTFANRAHSVPSIGGARIKTVDGQQWEQLDFADMDREQLLAQQRQTEDQAFAARRTNHHIRRHLALLDQRPDAATPREAARLLGIDLPAWLAEESS
ncbi:MAG: hypothetical protein ACRDMV_20980 [Streptosporangiales bacterium]